MTIRKIIVPFLALMLFGVSNAYSQSQQNDNEKIISLIAKKRAFNKNTGFGYRIQLYNGSETRARRILGGFSVKFPGISTYIRYKSPEWKVQVGNYKTQLAADRALLQFKGKYTGAIVIPKNRG